MNKKLLAPLAAIALSLVILVTASFNLGSSSLPGESGTDYFIKSIQADRVLLVEPNLLSFVNSNTTDNSMNERLLDALEEIGQSYTVDSARPIQITKNIGTIVPNLVVYVQPKPLQQDISDALATGNAVTIN
jgi:tyrosine-protein phosphatase YwqE